MARKLQGQTAFAVAFVLLSAVVVGIGVYAYRDLRSAAQESRRMHAQLVRELDLIGELQYQTQEARRNTQYLLTTTDANLQVHHADETREADARVAEMIAAHMGIASSTEAIQAGTRLHRDWNAYLHICEEVIAYILEGSVQEGIQLDQRDGAPAFERVREDLQQIKQLYVEQSEHQLAQVDTASQRLLVKVIAILCLTLLFLIGFAIRTMQRDRMLRLVVQSESRLREVMESIHEGMFVVGRNGRVSLWNGAAEKIMDRTRGRVLDRPLLQAIPELDGTSMLAAVADAMQSGRPVFLQDFHFSGRLNKRSFEVRLFPFEEGTTVFFNDVTERKNLEEQLRQSQKMEAVGRLSGGIAHDFNNLLGVIIGYSDILEVRVGDDGSLAKSVKEIKKAGQRAASLTRQLLAFSRQQVLEPKILDLNVVVSDAEKMLRRLIGEDVELTIALDPALARVKADEGQIGQIILNLAVNARDAMPQGGKLVLETKNVELDRGYAEDHSHIVPGPYVLLAVSDTGVGMDAETQKHIFEPFFTTKEVGKGTGLGLATVYGVVKQSGGYIWVYSELGKGTTFKIYLPRVEKTVPLTELGSTRGKALQQAWETILLVEDEESLRTLTRGLLSQAGYTVLEASSGSQAMEIAQQHKNPIHLLLTDVVMPGISGRLLAENLSQVRPGLKVLYMSGYTEYAIANHGILESGTTLLQKPFTRETLVKKIRETLAGANGDTRDVTVNVTGGGKQTRT